MKIPPSLLELIDEGVLDDVHSRLLSGKEASVFIVERDGMQVAAKVYKQRDNRSFKNVASYLEGRSQTRNSRDRRAMNRKSRYGRELLEEGWRDAEHNALQRAFYGGVRVPEPFLLHEDVLLMELVVDEAGDPAPRLADLDLPVGVAELLHLEVFLQVRRLLACDLVHGDLSAFNVLYAADGPTIIDMPQAVDAAANTSAEELLVRDLQNVTEHFARFDARLLRFRHCGRALWRHYKAGSIDQVRGPEEGGGERRGRGRKHGRGRRGRAVDAGSGGPKKSRRSPGPEIVRAAAAAAHPKAPKPAPVTSAAPPAESGSGEGAGAGKKKNRRRRRGRGRRDKT
jgi:RIO kinase 1